MSNKSKVLPKKIEFLRWLDNQAKNVRFYKEESSTCPLGRYFNTMHPEYYWNIDRTSLKGYRPEDKDEVNNGNWTINPIIDTSTKPWMDTFVGEVDKNGPGRITRDKAIHIMEAIIT